MRLRAYAAIFAHAGRATAWRLRWPLAAAGAAAWAGATVVPPLPGSGADGDVAAHLWLHVPCLLVATAGVGAALEAWPLLCRGRPGAASVRRLRPPGIEGCVPAVAGALAMLALALAAAAALFCGALAAHGSLRYDVRAHAPFEIRERRPLLGVEQPRLHLRSTTEAPVEAVRLRALAFWDPGQAYRAARVRLSSGGEPLHGEPLRIEGSHEAVVLRLPARPLPALEITAVGGGPELLFLPGSVEAVVAGAHGTVWNGVLAALAYLVPAAQALAFVCVLRRQLRAAIAAVAGAIWVMLSPLFGWLPNGAAIDAFASGRWLPAEHPLRAHAGALAAVALLLVVAACAGRRGVPP